MDSHELELEQDDDAGELAALLAGSPAQLEGGMGTTQHKPNDEESEIDPMDCMVDYTENETNGRVGNGIDQVEHDISLLADPVEDGIGTTRYGKYPTGGGIGFVLKRIEYDVNGTEHMYDNADCHDDSSERSDNSSRRSDNTTRRTDTDSKSESNDSELTVGGSELPHDDTEMLDGECEHTALS